MAKRKETSISVDQDQFICPVCLDLLKDPVTISCGHRFCMKCINDHWDQEDQRRIYSCPQCREKFNTRLELWRKTGSGKNVMPEEVHAASSSSAESGDVKHKLGEASTKLQEICSQHDKPLEIYCYTDRSFICYLCLSDEHKGHDTVSAETERHRKWRRKFIHNQDICPVCRDLLKNPVTISCGHCVCMKCFNYYWDQEDQRRIYSCPQCRVKFNMRPELWRKTGSDKNVMSEEVRCASSAASTKLQKKICSQHSEPLMIYCLTDKSYICYLCLRDEHKDHDTVPALTERLKLHSLSRFSDGSHNIALQKHYLLSKRSNLLAQLNKLSIEDSDQIPSHGTKAGKLLISPVPEVFIPEMSKKAFKNNNSYRFRHQHSGQFQCKVTSLVFEVEEIKGEVLYRIDSWDTRLLDGLGQMKPAGPLYNIDCFEGSVSHMHLPHCEILTGKHQVELVVAHFTGDNVEIIQPLKVTNTHVIISIQGFSLFGLLKRIFFYASPVNGQVLLFYKDVTGRRSRKKLHIHLLPGNVPAEEVKDQHTDFRTIKTSSRCQLTLGQKYRPRFCHPYRCQPRVEQFECDYGPNYHPTFEVFLHSKTEVVTVSLLDEQDQKIWEPRLILLTDDDTDAATPKMNLAGAEQFVDKNRSQLIQEVKSVMEIADCLKSKLMITEEMYSNIQAVRTSQEQMRMLYEALKSGGAAVKAEFYHILKQKQPHLVNKLHQTSETRP